MSGLRAVPRALFLVAGLSSLRVFAEAAEPSGCQEPLDEETLQALVLHSGSPSIQPGRTLSFWLGTWECCVFIVRVPACVEWSVEPPGTATLEILPYDGDRMAPSVHLTVAEGVPHGTVITLRADVEAGRRILETNAYVYTREGNPLVGNWSEALQDRCLRFARGDVDQSGSLDITDPVRILDYLFLGMEAPACTESADANGDLLIDLTDGICLLSYLFTGGRRPPDPFPACGPEVVSALGCESFPACGERFVAPEMPIEELLFEADGTFSVTWTPFEVYRDYWGTYVYDLRTGAIELIVAGGNYVPPDIRCFDCTFAVEGETLYLRNLWLGSPPCWDPPCPTAEFICGHVFR